MQTGRVVLQSKAQPVTGTRVASQRWPPLFPMVGDGRAPYSFPIIVVVSNAHLSLVEHHDEISPFPPFSPILQTP
jgi:hypothetical protein